MIRAALIEALEERIREIAREEAARPAFVSQRNVESVTSLPRRDYLRLARDAAFPTMRERRLVMARTADVIAYVERRIAIRAACPSNDADAEAAAFARSGARRVAR